MLFINAAVPCLHRYSQSIAVRKATYPRCGLSRNGTVYGNGATSGNGITGDAQRDLERVRTLRARENAAARLERFQEAKMARNALVAALYALPDEVRVREATEQFYSAWKNADEVAMMRRWAPHGSISTVFPLNKPIVGHKAVAEQWIKTFAAHTNNIIRVEYDILNVHISESTAWVVVSQMAPSRYASKPIPNIATIVFRRVGAEWLTLHHHSSPVVADAPPDNNNNSNNSSGDGSNNNPPPVAQ